MKNRIAFFRYLDELKASGIVNMYRAGSFLQEDFGMERKQAQLILIEWMAARNKERFRKVQ